MIIRMHLFLLNGNRELGSAILTEFRTDDILLSAAWEDSTLRYTSPWQSCTAVGAELIRPEVLRCSDVGAHIKVS